MFHFHGPKRVRKHLTLLKGGEVKACTSPLLRFSDFSLFINIYVWAAEAFGYVLIMKEELKITVSNQEF